MPSHPPPTPTPPQRLDLGLACGLSDVGTVRARNEDNFLIAPALGLLAVADGMGGHADGEVASAGALDALARHLRAALAGEGDPSIAHPDAGGFAPLPADPDATWTDARMWALGALHAAVDHANRQLHEANLAAGRADGGGMGTTLTGLWQPAAGGPLFVFHVGDTRLYRYRDGALTQLTRDQTMYQQALDAGFEHDLPPRNLLLQALGPGPEVSPDLAACSAAPGDLYLLCSDGLHGACGTPDIAAVLARAAPDALALACGELVEMAKRDGSRDNITAVLVGCARPAGHQPGKTDGVPD